MSLIEDINNESKKYGGMQQSSDYFNFQKGENRVRILTKPNKIIALHFFGEGQRPAICVGIDEGCPHHTEDSKNSTKKLVAYIIDRKDGKVKLAELPLAISYTLNDLHDNPEYEFGIDDYPMPFDVNIIHDPDNKDPKAKYRLQPSPKRVELTAEEKEAFNKAMEDITPEEYIEKRKKKQKGEDTPEEVSTGGDNPDPDSVPF